MEINVYSIDVDQTLTNETCWTDEECRNATPNLKVIQQVNEWHKTGFVVIHTARRDFLYQATVDWLRKNGVKFHAICMEKMPANRYLDDKAIRPDELPEL